MQMKQTRVIEHEVRVSANIQASSSVPVSVMVGGAAAQNTVTVAVR
jgi:hypothetical protein